MHACSAGLAANASGRLAETVGIFQAFSVLTDGFQPRHIAHGRGTSALH
jgi:hypothetical protein